MALIEKITSIADEVRELSGTTELMGLTAIASNVGEANSEINNQAELLAQIISALDGKAAGGSGGSGMNVAAHSNGATDLTLFYGGTASIPVLTIKAAFESAVAE